jgi:hypothetical protein
MHEHIPAWLGMFYYLLIVIVLCVITSAVVIMEAWFSAKKQVKNTPREPFEICPIHGGYPLKYSMRTIAEGFDAPIEHCPFCFKERVAKKKVL